MRKLLVILGVCAAVMVGSSSLVFSDFMDGIRAYNRGDYATALKEFRAAAEQGDVSAQGFLGLMYIEGTGVTQDDKEAVKWFRKAAEQGVADAQFNLGFMYGKGRGVTQDDKEAVKRFPEEQVITSRLISALPPKADIRTAVEKGPLMTQSGHLLDHAVQTVRKPISDASPSTPAPASALQLSGRAS